MPGWTTKVSHSLPTQKNIPSATAEKSLQHKIQLLNSSCHVQEIEQSGTANYFTFNKKIQEYPKQKPERHTRRSAHPTLFHGTFCGKIHLQYHENSNFKIHISNQLNLMSSLSRDFQEKSTFPLHRLQKERLFTQRHSCYWRKACQILQLKMPSPLLAACPTYHHHRRPLLQHSKQPAPALRRRSSRFASSECKSVLDATHELPWLPSSRTCCPEHLCPAA